MNDLRIVRPGELHSASSCVFCGDRNEHMIGITFPLTRAPAKACDDVMACERRRNRQKYAAA